MPQSRNSILSPTGKQLLTNMKKRFTTYRHVLMGHVEQNYIDSEYESKLEFQSMWDDLKNKVWRESRWAGVEKGRKKV